MRAVLLAAGMGSRLKKYTQALPKGMLPFRDKPLLAWQIESLIEAGIDDIVIVTGYLREKIQFKNVTYFHNANYATTNMIESLMQLKDILSQKDTLLVYSDILFSKMTLEKVLSTQADIVVGADLNWRPYWLKRYGTTETDLESLFVDDTDHILSIGESLHSSDNVHCRYIGMNKFSQKALTSAQILYEKKQSVLGSWQPSGKSFYQGYFTDLIHELIQFGMNAKIAPVMSGWLEFDTEIDYEMVQALDNAQQLHELIEL